ncbi:ZZ-type zinc finger-containing protein 3-like, partial [Tropilaelaps mercedesae]
PVSVTGADAFIQTWRHPFVYVNFEQNKAPTLLRAEVWQRPPNYALWPHTLYRYTLKFVHDSSLSTSAQRSGEIGCWAPQMEEDVHHSSRHPLAGGSPFKREPRSPPQEGVTSFVEDNIACETVVTFYEDIFPDERIDDDVYDTEENINVLDTASVPDPGGAEASAATSNERTLDAAGPSGQSASTSIPTSTSTLDVERHTFSFETDHLALRANDEYKSIVKLLVLLEAQRMRAVHDINQLEAEKKAALENPTEFVRQLQLGAIALPTRQIVPEVPEVDYSKYSIPASYLGAASKSTRAAAGSAEADPSTGTNSSHVQGSSSTMPLEPSLPYSEAEQLSGQLQQHPLKNKPETHNKPWSIEEQKRLEELLIQYPPEAVEAQRWRKIAAALGNRTIKQVASRVQKYFIKLAKAGLEVPGRVPNIPKSSRKVRRVQSTLKTQAFYLSTFFPQHANPIVMDPDAPLQESPVVLPEPATSKARCGVCLKKLDGGFRFHCEECNINLCVEDSCRQKVSCASSGHVVQMVADTQVDSDYVIDNHYLDPNYLPSTS